MKKIINALIYVLIFSAGVAIVSLIYPYIEGLCMATREKAVPGGELMLWLVPFMVCVAVSTARQWKKEE